MDLLAAKVKSVALRRASDDNESEQPLQKLGMVVDMTESSFMTTLLPVVGMNEKDRHPYSRPEFLYFSEEETELSSDQSTRPVLCPKYPAKMPAYCGYAEVINAGKTIKNEDMATAKRLRIIQHGYNAVEAVDMSDEKTPLHTDGRKPLDEPLLIADNAYVYIYTTLVMQSSDESDSPPFADAAYFAIFDGHAGSGAALMASYHLSQHIVNRLGSVVEAVITLDRRESLSGKKACHITPNVTVSSLVVGALETAFLDMDDQIQSEKQQWRIPGGCAAIVALVILDKLYIANAGDCRAILLSSQGINQLSTDFNPAQERKRLQFLAYKQPELIGSCFSRLEYNRYLNKKDLKGSVLYRDWYMDGWGVKTVTEQDILPPLICERRKKYRLLNTIGVSRGFGDHHLITVDDKIPIKPFLTAVPQVQVFDISSLNVLTDRDVVVMGSDGLWDVLSNERVSEIVKSVLDNSESDDHLKYTIAAQELVIAARGNPTTSGKWTLTGGGQASTDDITAFVIPLKYAISQPSGEDEDDDEEMLK
uniref:PPM-type phosphatase domain-containing protein n=1 Tax=Steinernema glaseri TaxID=37863 RepID=A0A1I7YBB6_9BILA